MFNSSLTDMKRNMASGQGTMYSIFAGGKLKQNDVTAITNYANAVKAGVKPTQAFKDNLGGCSVAAKRYVVDARRAGKSTDEMVVGLKQVPKATTAASVGFKALSVAANIGLTVLASFAVSAIIGWIDDLVHAQERAIEKAEKINSKFQEQQNTLANNKKTIDSISSDYEKLSKGVSDMGTNISLSTEEYSRYNDIVNQIADMFPTMVKGYTAEGNAIIAHKGNVEELTKAYKEQAKAARDGLISKGDDIFSGAEAELDQLNEKIKTNEAAQWLLTGAKVYHGVDAAKNPYSSDIIQKAEKLLKEQGIERQTQRYASGATEETYALIRKYNPKTQSYDDPLPEDVELRAEKRNNLERDYNLLLAQRGGILSKTNSVLQAYLENEITYENQSEDVKKFISMLSSSLDPSNFDFDDDKMKAWIKNNFLIPISEATPETQKSIENLLSLDVNKMSATDYENQVGKLLQIITKELNLSQEELEGLIVQLGFDVDFTKIENLKSQLRNKFGDEFNDVINELSLEELEIASKLKFVEGMTPDDLRTEIDALSSRDITIDVKVNETFSDIVNDTMSKTQSVVDSTTKSFEGLAKVQEAVANGYKLSTTAALELAKSYPEILNGATTTADGQMKLNKEVVDAVLSGNQAQLDSAIDKQIGELEAEKVSLEAKKQSAITGLQIVEAALMAEDAAEKQKAIEKIKTANEVLDEMIKAGYSETEANRIACDVMSGNTTEYDRIAKEVAQNADSNFSISAKNIADNVFKNMKNAATSGLNFGKQCWESAKAFLGIGSKDPSSPNDVMGGSGGTGDTSDDYKLVDDGTFDSFDGSSIEDLNLQLDELKLNLQDTITGIDDGLSAIDGQISALNSLKIQSNNRDFDSGDSKKSGGSGSDKNSPEYTDPTDAIIDRINLKQKELAIEEERLENEIELAEASGDNRKQISLTNDLIATRKKRVEELNTANAGLHNKAQAIRDANPWDEESWFDSQGNATETYYDLYNSSSKADQEKIKNVFESISKYKKAWVDNNEEIIETNKQILQDEENIWDIRREIFDARMEESEYYIQHSKDFGWENGDNEIKARKRVLEWIQSDYYKSLIKDDIEYYKILEENRLKYNEALKEEFDKSTDLGSSYYDSKKTLLQSYFDVTNSIAEAQHDINKELEASKTMYEYLDEDTRKLLFNQEDYNALSKELIDIQSEADRLQRQYEYDLKHSTLDTIEEITSNYEMQYETLMKNYEIAKADLEIAKKKQKLDNVLNEKNVRMRINGQWQWVAKTQDVIDAQSELADAEYAKRVAESGLTQQKSIDDLTKKQNQLGTIISQFSNGVISLDDAIGNIVSRFRDLPDNILNSLRGISTTSASSSSSSSGTYYSYSGRTLQVNSDGTAPKGAQNGDIIQTAGGDYLIVPAGSKGATYNSDSGYYSIKVKEKLADGTRSTLGGMTLLGEEDFEAFIDNNGHLIPINQPTIGNIGAGGIVFNQDQMTNLRSLWDLSNIGTMPNTNISNIVNRHMGEMNTYQMYGNMIFDGNNPEEIFRKMADFFKNTRYKSN